MKNGRFIKKDLKVIRAKLKYYFIKIIIFQFLFKSVCVNLITKRNTRFLINHNSEINLVIIGTGTDSQNFMFKLFSVKPSEVYINEGRVSSCENTYMCRVEVGSNNMKLRFNSQLTTVLKMFYNVKNIKEIDFSNFDFSKVETMEWMLYGCSDIEKINFKNINTILVKNMKGLFKGCSLLTSIDVSNFDTSEVTTMDSMFAECTNLKTLDVSNFKTSNSQDMYNMFGECSSLTYLDLSSFDTSNVKNFQEMFNKCSNLKYLDLSNFITSEATTIYYMFYQCSSLIYLNIKSFQVGSITSSLNMNCGLSNLPSSVKFCIQDESLKTKFNTINNDCSDICFNENIKIDESLTNKCVESCNNYEYNKFCIDECPTGSLINGNICEDNPCLKNKHDFIECLDNTPEGYYYDSNDGYYKICFETCKFCNGPGDEANNNCYGDDSSPKNSNKNSLALVSTTFFDNCQYYYYIDDSNNFHCIEECPESYNKLIIEKKQCIDDCKNEDKYYYEFNNTCYEKCPEGTYLLSNHEDYKCYNIAPDGYYLDSTEEIFKKCYESCNKCQIGGTENNNNCIECKPDYSSYINPYNIINCYKICQSYYYFDEENNYICIEKCPEEYELIKEQNKCILKNNNDGDEMNSYLTDKNYATSSEKHSEIIYNYSQQNHIYDTEISEKIDSIDIKKNQIYDTKISEKIDSTDIKQNQLYDTKISENIDSTDIKGFLEETNKIKKTESSFISSNSIAFRINDINEEDNSLYNIIKQIFFNNKVITNNYLDLTNSNKDEIQKTIQKMIKNGFNISIIDEGNIPSLSLEGFTYTITSTLIKEINKNKSNILINLGQCEEELKDKYNISKNNSLYLFIINGRVDNIPKVEYEVFYPFSENNFSTLNLTHCKNMKIDILIPIDIPINDLDKYNKSSGLYNDICYTLTTENYTDISLKDRRNEYVDKNYSICEEDCDFTEYDNVTKRAKCSCMTKLKLPMISEIKVDKDKMLSNFKDIRNIANFKMMKCTHLLINKDNMFKNAANYMIFILFTVGILAMLIFTFYNNSKIKEYIFQIDKKISQNKNKDIINIKETNKKTINKNLKTKNKNSKDNILEMNNKKKLMKKKKKKKI